MTPTPPRGSASVSEVPERPWPPATGASSSNPGAVRIRPSKSEWEANKPTIIKLYMDQELSLKDVMHIMVTEHGMSGTTYGPRHSSVSLDDLLRQH